MENGIAFIVMEYVPDSLDKHLSHGRRVPWRRAVEIAAQVARALDHAHDNGVVHRDIKPSNILLQADGAASVSDFGIARALASSTRSRTTSITGTPPYMAPEQWSGGPVDGRLDQYALGIVLYEMISGRLPFQGDSYEALFVQHRDTPVPRLPANARVPSAVEGIIQRATERTPDARYSSSGAMAGALEGVLTGRLPDERIPTAASPPRGPSGSAPPPSWPHLPTPSDVRSGDGWWNAFPFPAFFVGAAILVIVGVILVRALGIGGPPDDRDLAQLAASNESGPATAPSSTDEPGNTSSPETAMPKPTSEVAPEATTEIIPVALPILGSAIDEGRISFRTNRGNEEIYVMNADGTAQTNLTNHLSGDWEPAFSPDGSRIAFVSGRDAGSNAEIYVMNSDGSDQVNITKNPAGDNREPDWSPDGSRIAFQSNRDGNGEIYVMDPDGSGQTNITNDPSDDYEPSWSPNGDRIAFRSNREFDRQDGHWDIYVMNADGTGQTNLTNNPMSIDAQPSWSPDGSKIAFQSRRDNNWDIYVMNSDGSGQKRLTIKSGLETQPVWSLDGRKIAFVSTGDGPGAGEIYTMNSDGSDQVNVTNSLANDSDPAWGPYYAAPPTNPRIAFFSNRDGNWKLWVMNPDGSGLTLVSRPDALFGWEGWEGNAAKQWPVGWSPDATKIAFASSIAKQGWGIFVANTDGSRVNRITHNEGTGGGPKWSPDGNRIIYTQTSLRSGSTSFVQDDIMVVNADGSNLRRLTNTETDSENGPVWSPDGQKIAFSKAGEIWVMSADGADQHSLSDGSLEAQTPNWSPDGTNISFSGKCGSSRGLCVMNSDGSDLIAVTKGGSRFRWSPDGRRFVFDGISIVNSDGTNVVQVSSHSPSQGKVYASWSPDGTTIVFEQGAGIWVMDADGSNPRQLTGEGDNTRPSWSP